MPLWLCAVHTPSRIWLSGNDGSASSSLSSPVSHPPSRGASRERMFLSGQRKAPLCEV